jgi:hemoglobin
MQTLPIVAAKSNPHYERIGGEAAVVRLVEAFYRAMDTREDARVIRAMHASDLGHTKAVLVMYLDEWLGGPRRYSAERGQPRLRRVHQPFAVDDAARAAWMACMQQALEETGVDSELKAALTAAFSRIAEHIQNR